MVLLAMHTKFIFYVIFSAKLKFCMKLLSMVTSKEHKPTCQDGSWYVAQIKYTSFKSNNKKEHL